MNCGLSLLEVIGCVAAYIAIAYLLWGCGVFVVVIISLKEDVRILRKFDLDKDKKIATLEASLFNLSCNYLTRADLIEFEKSLKRKTKK